MANNADLDQAVPRVSDPRSSLILDYTVLLINFNTAIFSSTARSAKELL